MINLVHISIFNTLCSALSTSALCLEPSVHSSQLSQQETVWWTTQSLSFSPSLSLSLSFSLSLTLTRSSSQAGFYLLTRALQSTGVYIQGACTEQLLLGFGSRGRDWIKLTVCFGVNGRPLLGFSVDVSPCWTRGLEEECPGKVTLEVNLPQQQSAQLQYRLGAPR